MKKKRRTTVEVIRVLCQADSGTTNDVGSQDKHSSSNVELPVGDIELRTRIPDEGGEELCGAYYIEAIKL